MSALEVKKKVKIFVLFHLPLLRTPSAYSLLTILPTVLVTPLGELNYSHYLHHCSM